MCNVQASNILVCVCARVSGDKCCSKKKKTFPFLFGSLEESPEFLGTLCIFL